MNALGLAFAHLELAMEARKHTAEKAQIISKQRLDIHIIRSLEE